MKTAVQEVMDTVETDYNNGVVVSQRVFWKMLLKAKELEKQQIIDAHFNGRNYYPETGLGAEQYYNETFTEL